MLASELVKNYHKDSISTRCAVKIDISKAFDSVQWLFFLSILKVLGLPEKFIYWLELCITTASFSVQVNGELAVFFRSSKGLHQGCYFTLHNVGLLMLYLFEFIWLYRFVSTSNMWAKISLKNRVVLLFKNKADFYLFFSCYLLIFNDCYFWNDYTVGERVKY